MNSMDDLIVILYIKFELYHIPDHEW